MITSLHTLPSPPVMAVLPKRIVSSERRVRRRDPAVNVMTDFTRETPVTVSEEQQIGATLSDMIRFGVRAMLVVRGAQVVGFITSYDIEGEKPMQYLQNSTYTRHHEILVRDIMTPLSHVVALNWRNVENASVDEVLDVFNHISATHMLVMESAQPLVHVRGLFSRAQIERQIMPEPVLHQKAS